VKIEKTRGQTQAKQERHGRTKSEKPNFAVFV